ncbi:MAG: EFR1 family ferrodoxin [Clostridium sp.]
MLGNIIYFSGTGNTEYIAKLVKDNFKQRDIETKRIDIIKKKNLPDDFDFLVLASPVYAERFPRFFIDHIKNKLPKGGGRKVMLLSTLGGKSSGALNELISIVTDMEYEVCSAAEILMPNNYYLAKGFKKPLRGEIELKKECAKDTIERIVIAFINNNKVINKSSALKKLISKPIHGAFTKYAFKWAKRSLTVNMDKCVMCSKCSKNCPTKNITIGSKFIFREDCISCFKCIHTCPVNAFLYKNREIDQYKL